ncbi:predicted protein [Uncinocarpus reesii 1704]|uniref:RHD domain-containing protein n=1 Tax=Uncinocarpus reesii (strain UAMH 1704) TaxID=336963 RepID=C4JS79_UNCRE|nr:uncharacterized protein UREG_05318 [Uncinocarpus reesii 1704]EEP80476.1 predicted protein [Uncinocarpus reesii 1704]
MAILAVVEARYMADMLHQFNRSPPGVHGAVQFARGGTTMGVTQARCMPPLISLPKSPAWPLISDKQSFILSTLPYTTLLPPLLLSLVLRPLTLNTLNYLPAGPTAILFALLAQYHAAIPTTYKYTISTGTTTTPSALTLHLSDKSTIYFLALQLSLSQFPNSLLPAAVGWIIGHAWRAELLPGRFSAPSWRIPRWVYGGHETAFDRRQGTAPEHDGPEAERYEGLRRRLEGESRAAAAARGEGSGVDGGETQRRRPLAGQIFDRFRGAF